ncbi:hypothetical protein [Novosphingobium resinovorum]|uniref:hypothetical protein n=1 Tax=Novosphingobium resinovorum TaxID=158500 RepID=UPI00138DDADB
MAGSTWCFAPVQARCSATSSSLIANPLSCATRSTSTSKTIFPSRKSWSPSRCLTG